MPQRTEGTAQALQEREPDDARYQQNPVQDGGSPAAGRVGVGPQTLPVGPVGVGHRNDPQRREPPGDRCDVEVANQPRETRDHQHRLEDARRPDDHVVQDQPAHAQRQGTVEREGHHAFGPPATLFDELGRVDRCRAVAAHRQPCRPAGVLLREQDRRPRILDQLVGTVVPADLGLDLGAEEQVFAVQARARRAGCGSCREAEQVVSGADGVGQPHPAADTVPALVGQDALGQVLDVRAVAPVVHDERCHGADRPHAGGRVVIQVVGPVVVGDLVDAAERSDLLLQRVLLGPRLEARSLGRGVVLWDDHHLGTNTCCQRLDLVERLAAFVGHDVNDVVAEVRREVGGRLDDTRQCAHHLGIALGCDDHDERVVDPTLHFGDVLLLFDDATSDG